jgi:hypothetical protein
LSRSVIGLLQCWNSTQDHLLIMLTLFLCSLNSKPQGGKKTRIS